jgi:hypothetical protein
MRRRNIPPRTRQSHDGPVTAVAHQTETNNPCVHMRDGIESVRLIA